MALSVSATTGTIAPNNTRDFEVPVGSTLTLTFPPNSQATVTENPLFVGKTTTAGNLDQRITRVDGPPQTVTCGPYPTGANVTVAVSVRSSATASFSLASGGVALGGGVSAYTWETKPAANSVPSGTLIQITGATLRGLWESDSTFWRYLRDVPLLANGNPGTVTSGTAETVLAAILIPAGALADNGAFEAEFVVSYTNSAGNKAFQMRLGGTGINGTSLWIQNVTTTRKQAFRVGFMNRNSTNSQVQTVSEYTAGYGGTTSAILTAALDTTVDQTVYITGQCTVGTDSAVLEAIMARLV